MFLAFEGNENQRSGQNVCQRVGLLSCGVLSGIRILATTVLVSSDACVADCNV
jgi:hypothetical protein